MHCFLILRALFVRFLFGAHGLLVIASFEDFSSDEHPWLLSSALAGLLLESLITLIKNKGEEWKWFSPCVFCYLLSVVPAIWLKELLPPHELNGNGTSMMMTNLPVSLKGKSFTESIATTKIQQQLLLLVLIIGRWIMPKGKLTRDQLSQLLLVHIGTAADIVDFYDAFSEPSVNNSLSLQISILIIWSISLLQFTIIVPSNAPDEDNQLMSNNPWEHITILCSLHHPIVPHEIKLNKNRFRRCRSILDNDVLSILLSILMQDLPFFALRLVLIVHFNLRSHSNLFFTTKNSLLMILMFYRLMVIVSEKRAKCKKQKEARRLYVKSMHEQVLKLSCSVSPPPFTDQSDGYFTADQVHSLDDAAGKVDHNSQDERNFSPQGFKSFHESYASDASLISKSSNFRRDLNLRKSSSCNSFCSMTSRRKTPMQPFNNPLTNSSTDECLNNTIHQSRSHPREASSETCISKSLSEEIDPSLPSLESLRVDSERRLWIELATMCRLAHNYLEPSNQS